MPRLSIDITPEEHKKLKAIAALKGKSIKDYVLDSTLGGVPMVDADTEADAIAMLSNFLSSRMDEARSGKLSHKSLADIRREARKSAGL